MPERTTMSPSRWAWTNCWRGFDGTWREPDRSEDSATRTFAIGDFNIDADAFRVTVKSREIRLTPKEFELLLYLARHAGRVVTHRTLLLAIWGPNSVEQPEHLRVLVAQLRKKIDTGNTPRYIITEPWVGYRFEPAGEKRLGSAPFHLLHLDLHAFLISISRQFSAWDQQ